MDRRAFIMLLGGAALQPLGARAQQRTVPVVGVLYTGHSDRSGHVAAAVEKGLSEAGLVVGSDATVEYRWAEERYDLLPELASELVRLNVAVIIATGGLPGARAAKGATSTVPIVFTTGADPVAAGLVDSLSRPGGNITGVSFIASSLGVKRLELLHELVRPGVEFALLVNPDGPAAMAEAAAVASAANTLGRAVTVLKARTADDIGAAFADIVRQRMGGLLVAADAFLIDRRRQLVDLAARHAVPAVYFEREFVGLGGLMSYSGSLSDTYRLAGVYAGRIVRGAKPSELPVLQATRFELVINLTTAKTLGLALPERLLAHADEVIE